MKAQLLLWASLLLYTVSATAQPNCSAPSTGFTPINDLGKGTFNTWVGGLYPNGSNFLPLAHKNAGIHIATTQIVPRNASGSPDTRNGKIVWLSIGMSNTTIETQQFIPKANAFAGKNPKLIFVDGAQGGQTASIISTKSNPNYSTFWSTVNTRLSSAGVTANQVQVIWFKEANRAGTTPVKEYYDSLIVQYKRIMNDIKRRFPNARLCYMASRISARYASSTLNPEPYAYWTGWAVKKVIEDQINGDAQLQYSGSGARSPLLLWGIYMWSDGITPQVSNPHVFWDCSTDFRNDGTHPSTAGAMKVANLLLYFYKNDSLSCPWFFKTPPAWCSNTTAMKDVLMTNDGVTFFQNPVNNTIYVKTTLYDYTGTLYNLQGQMIYQKQNVKEMNVAELSAGLYFFTIKSKDGQLQTSKLLITR